MKNLQALQKSLIALILLSGFLALAGIGFLYQFQAARDRDVQMHRDQEALYDQQDRLVDLYWQLGYTRFIHNFKNAVLRHDAEALKRAQVDMQNVRQILIDIRTLNSGFGEELDAIAGVISEYDEKLKLLPQLFADGMSTADIDAQVKVDDDPARRAIRKMRASIDTARDSRERLFEDENALRDTETRMVAIAAIGMLIIAAILCFIFIQATRHTHALVRTRKRLIDVSKRFEPVVKAEIASNLAGLKIPAVDEQTTEPADDPYVANLEIALMRLTKRIELQQRTLIDRTDSLAETNVELSRFAYVASHDLQEPLRKIQSNIDLIELKHGDKIDDDLRERLGRIKNNVGGMRQLISDLLAYSEDSRRPLNVGAIDLGAMLTKITFDLRDLAAEKSGIINCRAADGITIDGDPTLIDQVFRNLVQNAIKFARPDVPPVVEIHAGSKGDDIVVTVADNGIGFDSQFSDAIFEPFKRLHSRAVYGGTGIGLSIVRQAVQRHGGTVKADPRPEGGALFTVILPASSLHNNKEAADD